MSEYFFENKGHTFKQQEKQYDVKNGSIYHIAKQLPLF